MARPTKYTPETSTSLLAAIEDGATFEQAAAAAGIHRDTLTEWRKRFPAFSVDLEKAEAAGVVARLARIDAAGRAGAWQADAWWLERRYPEQWGRRDKVQVEHSGELALEVTAARSAMLEALIEFPEARLAVAEALDLLDAEQQQQQAKAAERERPNGNRR